MTTDEHAPDGGDHDHHLGATKSDWEIFAQEDPLWSILTAPDKRGGRWMRDEFLATGEGDVARALARIEALDVQLAHGHALDFGCGVGRLTFALARRFERVTGVDVAPTMLELARRWNPHPERVQFVHGEQVRLPFADASFDFVLSHLVLQHIPADAALQYVSEFVRVLRPGGAATFSIPVRFGKSHGRQHGESQFTFGARQASMHMHALPIHEVAGTLERAGGEIVRIDAPTTADVVQQAFYVVRRPV